jgi:hypothetical protein
MAGFSDTIKLTIDVVSGQTTSFKSFLKGAAEDIKNAEGGLDKLKTTGSNAFQFIQQNAGAFALGAGTALVGFGAKAVSTFQETALGAGHLRDALGLSADQASRYLEVSNDLGIGQDALATAFGRMLKTAGSTPQVFHDLGVQIAYAKDGSVDANQTFLNAVDALHNMTDPAQRAAAATKLFGKSWQNMAEVIDMGAVGLKQRLDDVQASKIVNNDQIAQGYKFRDAVDNVRDAVEGLLTQIGADLVPTLTTLAGALGATLGPLDKFNEGLHKLDHIPGLKIITEALNPLLIGFHAASDAAHQLTGDGGAFNTANIDKGTQALLDQTSATDKQANATRQAAASADGAAPSWAKAVNATGDWRFAQEGLIEKFKLGADGLQGFAQQSGTFVKANEDGAQAAKDQAAALQAASDAADAAAAAQKRLTDAVDAERQAGLESADADVAAADAQTKFADAAANTVKVQNDSKSSSNDKRDAVNQERDAMIDAAKAQENLAVQNAAAQGVTLTAADKVDAFNQSLLANAHFATPAAREAIGEYIIKANNVPPEKATAIRAAIAAGDFDTAQRLLAEAARTRNSVISVSVNGADHASQTIDNASRDRTSTIRVNTIFGGGTDPLGSASGSKHARGGVVGPNEAFQTINEEGPELIKLPTGAEVMTAAATQQIIDERTASAASAAGGGGDTIVFAPNVSVTVGVGANVREFERAVENALAALVRRNGPGPLQRALKIA